ncbi:thiol-disulfide oxidoreductase DCC family protein [Paenibacillus ehimensis]|uniref:Thiol-disulfide oxidoreductase DCC family protein n=1 Tax=Paenibacillus ehimensis TaxID=79264 RepID=A0ABT8VKC6_9BACL|nr:thiol-disulfide oxidoreductase DCC family protein [Paenibacillus ehimensis]MDO3681438.1 thiol-disulfide oxidoreductase DCC family protein [Paenibacillus ehimensis]
MEKSSRKDTEAERHPLVFYDGVCGFCQRVVQFIIPRDRSAIFRFVAIQSETGSRLLRRHGLDPAELNTFVLLEQGRVYTRSTAGLRVLRRLDGAWPLLYALIVVPRPVRDLVYKWIAANRYRFFGKSDSCMLPPPEVRERFLDT